MKTMLLAGAACALAVALSGCAGNAAALDVLNKIVTDPRCGHDDKVAVVAGAFGTPGSLTASAERHCPMPSPAAPLTTGAVVAPVNNATAAPVG